MFTKRFCSIIVTSVQLCLDCFQDLEDDEYDVRKPKKQRRSIVRTPSITRVREVTQLKYKKTNTSWFNLRNPSDTDRTSRWWTGTVMSQEMTAPHEIVPHIHLHVSFIKPYWSLFSLKCITISYSTIYVNNIKYILRPVVKIFERTTECVHNTFKKIKVSVFTAFILSI